MVGRVLRPPRGSRDASVPKNTVRSRRLRPRLQRRLRSIGRERSLCRASPRASGQRFLCVTFRGCGCRLHRWVRRFQQRDVGNRNRKSVSTFKAMFDSRILWGLYYTAFTQLLGFPKYGDEYKMMGLSAYGEPRHAQQVRDVVRSQGDQVVLNLDDFIHHTQGVEMTWEGGEPALGNRLLTKNDRQYSGTRRATRSEPYSGCGHSGFRSAGPGGMLLQTLELTRKNKKDLPCWRSRSELRCERNALRTQPLYGHVIFSRQRMTRARRSAPRCMLESDLKATSIHTMRHVYYGSEFSDERLS